MKPSELEVIGMGMVTSVGHTATQSCASIHANIARFDESQEFVVEDNHGHDTPVTLAAASGVTDGQRRFLRLFRMALRSISEAIRESGLSDKEMAESALYLCLAEEGRPGLDNRAEQALAKKLSQSMEIEDLTPRCKVFAIGHAAGFYAIKEAMHDLAQGRHRMAIIGAVDTYLDRVTLQWLKEMNWLKTEENVDGFTPGEGAAFMVLKQPDNLSGKNGPANVIIGGVETAFEENSIYEKTACQGDGLSKSIAATMDELAAAGQEAELVICDLNGQRYRSLEWGLTVPRAFQKHTSPPELMATATCIGNTGAAAATINICYGVKALQEGYTQSRAVVVWGSSDDGQRGSLYIRQQDE